MFTKKCFNRSYNIIKNSDIIKQTSLQYNNRLSKIYNANILMYNLYNQETVHQIYYLLLLSSFLYS